MTTAKEDAVFIKDMMAQAISKMIKAFDPEDQEKTFLYCLKIYNRKYSEVDDNGDDEY